MASHSDFRAIFNKKRGGRSEMPYCTLVRKTKYTQHIKIVDRDEEFDVISWSPLKTHREEIVAPTTPGASHDQEIEAVNFPVVDTGGTAVTFCGQRFKQIQIDQVIGDKLATEDKHVNDTSKRVSRNAGEGLFEDLLAKEILKNGLNELPEVFEREIVRRVCHTTSFMSLKFCFCISTTFIIFYSA